MSSEPLRCVSNVLMTSIDVGNRFKISLMWTDQTDHDAAQCLQTRSLWSIILPYEGSVSVLHVHDNGSGFRSRADTY